MGILTKKQINLDTKTPAQEKIIRNYFFSNRFSSYNISDRHYCDLVLSKKDSFKCLDRAIAKLALSSLDISLMDPLESLSFSYDGDYLYKNGNSSKAKYLCMFLGPKQLFFYTYTFDMISSNFQESASEIFYNSIIAISTEEQVKEDTIDLFGFISPTGKRTINTLVKLKITTAGGDFEFFVQKAPDVEVKIQAMRNKIRAFKTIKVRKNIAEDLL